MLQSYDKMTATFLYEQLLASLLFIFVLFLFQKQLQFFNFINMTWTKRRWCAWEMAETFTVPFNSGKRIGKCENNILLFLYSRTRTPVEETSPGDQYCKLWPNFWWQDWGIKKENVHLSQFWRRCYKENSWWCSYTDNKTLSLHVGSHVTSFTQSDCFISA